jgi:hypothetical protein
MAVPAAPPPEAGRSLTAKPPELTEQPDQAPTNNISSKARFMACNSFSFDAGKLQNYV